MPKWSLKIGNNREITVDECGNLQHGTDSIFDAHEKDAVVEAMLRVKKMRYYIVGEDTKKVINFSMFYRRYQEKAILCFPIQILFGGTFLVIYSEFLLHEAVSECSPFILHITTIIQPHYFSDL